ncbi:MAG: hypothetical protein RXR51_06345 [Nitrososphaeria archaeon]
MSSVIFYSIKKVRNHIRKRNVFPEDLMYEIQEFFNKKNETSKIKHVRFALHDIIEEDKHIRRSLVVEICTDSQNADEIENALSEMLTLKFPSLNASVQIHCEE